MKHLALLTLLLAGAFATAFAEDAPAFSLAGRDSSVTLSAYKGKIVYLDFWASWCQPCKDSFPWMNELQKEFGTEHFALIAVNLDKDRAKAEKFLENNPASFTIAFDPEGTAAKSYNVSAMPSTYILDSAGQIVKSHMGFREKDKEDLRATIESLVHPK